MGAREGCIGMLCAAWLGLGLAVVLANLQSCAQGRSHPSHDPDCVDMEDAAADLCGFGWCRCIYVSSLLLTSGACVATCSATCSFAVVLITPQQDNRSQGTAGLLQGPPHRRRTIEGDSCQGRRLCAALDRDIGVAATPAHRR